MQAKNNKYFTFFSKFAQISLKVDNKRETTRAFSKTQVYLSAFATDDCQGKSTPVCAPFSLGLDKTLPLVYN
jgi:hypothetical protein